MSWERGSQEEAVWPFANQPQKVQNRTPPPPHPVCSADSLKAPPSFKKRGHRPRLLMCTVARF